MLETGTGLVTERPGQTLIADSTTTAATSRTPLRAGGIVLMRQARTCEALRLAHLPRVYTHEVTVPGRCAHQRPSTSKHKNTLLAAPPRCSTWADDAPHVGPCVSETPNGRPKSHSGARRVRPVTSSASRAM
jgi:hypothetical protein